MLLGLLGLPVLPEPLDPDIPLPELLPLDPDLPALDPLPDELEPLELERPLPPVVPLLPSDSSSPRPLLPGVLPVFADDADFPLDPLIDPLDDPLDDPGFLALSFGIHPPAILALLLDTQWLCGETSPHTGNWQTSRQSSVSISARPSSSELRLRAERRRRRGGPLSSTRC